MLDDITAEYLRTRVLYDPNTGVFLWTQLCGPEMGGKVAGHVTRGYLRLVVDGQRYVANRLAWLYTHGEWPEGRLYYVNGNPLDNRLDNIERVNAPESADKPRRSVHGHPGVYPMADGRYKVSLCVNGRTKYVATMPCFKTAQAARIAAKDKWIARRGK